MSAFVYLFVCLFVVVVVVVVVVPVNTRRVLADSLSFAPCFSFTILFYTHKVGCLCHATHYFFKFYIWNNDCWWHVLVGVQQAKS